MQYHIKRCLAPCAGYVSREDYGKMIKAVCMLLDGRTSELERELKLQMRKPLKIMLLKKLPESAINCRL